MVKPTKATHKQVGFTVCGHVLSVTQPELYDLGHTHLSLLSCTSKIISLKYKERLIMEIKQIK